MDGTLLNSNSLISTNNVEAIRAAIARGVMVVAATGKARPAVQRAMERVGLLGDGLVASDQSPGVFLQGLQVHGKGGRVISNASLPPRVVEAAFLWSLEAGTLNIYEENTSYTD